MVERYKAGATERELGDQFGIHRTTVAAHPGRAAVPTRRGRSLRPGELDEAAHLYAQGWSVARLSERYGVSGHTVTAARRKAGVSIRRRGRPAEQSRC